MLLLDAHIWAWWVHGDPNLRPNMAVESTRLGPEFHRDPADQIIVATARVLACPLLASDKKIIRYAGVRTLV